MKVDTLMLCAPLCAVLAGCSAATSTGSDDGSWSLEQATSDGAVLGVWGSGPNDVPGGRRRPGADRSARDARRWLDLDADRRSRARFALLFSVYGFSSSGRLLRRRRRRTHLALRRHHVDTGRVGHHAPAATGCGELSGDDVWIVGGDIKTSGAAVVLRGTHGSFAAVDLPSGLAPSVLFKAHGFAADDVMMVGSEGTVLRWNGTAWSRDTVPTTEPLLSTWARGVADVYAVGGSDVGEIVHYDGTQWSEVAQLPIGGGLSGVFTFQDEPTVTVGLPFVIRPSLRTAGSPRPRCRS